MTYPIAVVYETTSEAIKATPVTSGYPAVSATEGVTIGSGQSREMLDQINHIFGIALDNDWDASAHGHTLNAVVANVLQGLNTEALLSLGERLNECGE